MIAVEPLDEMRALLARELPAVEVLDGTAEDLPLPAAGVDAVTVGQAFHWFDAERALAELHRVLRPGGAVGLVWNVRDPADDLQQALDEILRPYRGETPSYRDGGWHAVVEASPRFGEVDEWSWSWEERHTRRQLVERLSSVSFVARLPAGERGELLARVREATAGLAEPFAFRYRTDVIVFPRSS